MEEVSHPLSYKNKKLYFDSVDISEIIKTHQTPFYLYSEKTLSQNFNRFQTAANEAGLNDHLICFALKSNSNKEILKTLAAQGSGADIVSGNELKRAIEAGIDPQKIVFSGVGKTSEEVELALNSSLKGVYSFNVESLEELELINELAHQKGKRARICFRLNPKVDAKTHKFISTGNKTHKFGLLHKDIIAAIKDPKYWTSSTLVGISIHIGSQLTDMKATKKALQALGETAKQCGVELEFLDVGGGLGINYDRQKDEPNLDKYMQIIKQSLSKYFEKLPRIVFEPGRIIAARSGCFIMKVIRRKISEGHHFLIVDGGMNDFVRPSLYNAYHEIYSNCEIEKDTRVIKTDIVGPICETADFFAYERKLPELVAGDFIALADAGAYGQTMSSNYNLRERPSEIYIKNEREVEVVTAREKYEYLR
jgi:diaminopimelate decarboxylase